MASTTKWDAEERNGGLIVSYGDLSGPMTKKEGLAFAGRIVTLCGESATTNASKTATAPAGKGPKKPRKK